MYCGMCGTILDAKTGLCFNCGDEMTMINRNTDEEAETNSEGNHLMAPCEKDEDPEKTNSVDIRMLFSEFSSRKRTLIAASIMWAISATLYVFLFCGPYECKRFGAVIIFPITISWLALWLYENIISQNNHDTDHASKDRSNPINLKKPFKDGLPTFPSMVFDGFFSFETKNGDIGPGHFIIAMMIIMTATWLIGFAKTEYCSRYGFSIDCLQQWAAELIIYNSVGLVLATIAWFFGITALNAEPRRKLFLSSFLAISFVECILLLVARYARNF
jgi:hypothetical protein